MQRYKQEIAEESFKLVEGMQGLMADKFLPETPPCDVDSSFTALLGLPANQAMELLHAPESIKPPEIAFAEIWSDKRNDQETLNYFNCTPTFPSNSDLVERASRLSIFAAAEYSPETNSVPSNSFENSLNMKNEPADSDSNLCSSQKFSDLKHLNERQRSTKRKGGRENKVHGSAKKNKIVEKRSSNTGEVNKDGEKLPYVHVRARRGQATDSHSLAERARREKINARMKLLQELVPGCSKITGTALVLEEIINHVQALQRQVEFLSMRLATVNPRFDFNLDSILAMESGYTFAGSIPSMLAVEPRIWPETQVTEGRRQQHQNPHPQIGLLRSPASERENPHSFITRELTDELGSPKFRSI